MSLPIWEEDLLDAEFVDDTAIFLRGCGANLACFQQALECFCLVSRAQINWHGFWIAGSQALHFGESKVGFDITAQQQPIAPLLLSITERSYWSMAHLSLAGCVVVAKQVLLATMVHHLLLGVL